MKNALVIGGGFAGCSAAHLIGQLGGWNVTLVESAPFLGGGCKELGDRFEKSYATCPFLHFLTVIGADLNVYTCQDKAYTRDGALGSIRDRRFYDFWFSEEARVKITAVDPSRICRHHCVAHTKNLALMDYLSIDANHGMFV